jgi:preprotein translocase subunit SecB
MEFDKKEVPLPKITPEEYRKILNDLELKSIYLRDFKGVVNRDSIPKQLEIRIHPASDFEISKDGSVRVNAHFEVSAKEYESKADFLNISLTYGLIFSSKETFTKDFFEVYKEVSLPVNIWPFVREFVNNTTARMNIPPLALPLLKRTPKRKIIVIRKRKTASK